MQPACAHQQCQVIAKSTSRGSDMSGTGWQGGTVLHGAAGGGAADVC